MILLHPNSLVQQALPRILKEVGDEYFNFLKMKFKEASELAFEKISKIQGLLPVKATAAMYMLVRIDMDKFECIQDDVDFCKKLLHEESVLLFPGQCFFTKNVFRVVIC